MHFNPSKCQFRKTEVKFFGMMLKRQGVVPDPVKIEALKSYLSLEQRIYCKVFLVL